jgi:ATP-dependent DNA helicase RecG
VEQVADESAGRPEGHAGRASKPSRTARARTTRPQPGWSTISGVKAVRTRERADTVSPSSERWELGIDGSVALPADGLEATGETPDADDTDRDGPASHTRTGSRHLGGQDGEFEVAAGVVPGMRLYCFSCKLAIIYLGIDTSQPGAKEMDEQVLRGILQRAEDYDVEYKTARASYSRGKLNDYCAALANENGGYLVLGVDNTKKVVGTAAFPDMWNQLAGQITTALQVRVKVYEVHTLDGRVLVFQVNRHDTGRPVQVAGGTGEYRYPIRDGESLVEMSQTTLEEIFAERDSDWSARVANGTTIDDLDEASLVKYRQLWAEHTRRPDRDQVSLDEMLADLQLIVDGQATYAAVLLFGKAATVATVAPDAEIIFEWRNHEGDIAYGDRKNWREGFISVEQEIWSTINARNTIYRYQEGFAQREIPAFDKEAIREAVINAFVHRDYTLTGRSIVIKASPESFYIENPGRLMPGVTLDNILEKSVWRNRHLAEGLEKIHLMERSSQGIDKIFNNTIKSGKGLPLLTASHDPSIQLVIPTQLKDQSFIQFLEQVSERHQTPLSLREVIELEKIRQGQTIVDGDYRDKFLHLGIIERVGQGRATKYILSRQYYKYANAIGEHTRLSGLARDVKRQIILEHLAKNGRITNAELQRAILDMSGESISRLLIGMRRDGLIVHEGPNRTGYWIATEVKKEAEQQEE